MEKKAVRQELDSLAEDSYFRDAYENMDPSGLSRSDRVAAWCLYHKQYFVLNTLYSLKKLANKVH